MAENRGKKFESHIKESFERVSGVSIDRIHDQTSFYKGSQNICDFIVYREPYEYYFECKSVHGNVLPFTNITDTQWDGLLAKSQIQGVFAGIICWWVDKDVTKFIPIQMLQKMKDRTAKSIRYDILACNGYYTIEIKGKKKRVFFDYDMEGFLNEISNCGQKESRQSTKSGRGR